MSEFVDDGQIRRILKGLSIPNNNKKNLTRRALRKGAGNLLKDKVRERLDVMFNKAGKPFEEESLNTIKRNIMVHNSKSKVSAGIVVYAKSSNTTSMGRGKTRREWGVNGALSLMLFGNYKNRPRRTRGGKKSRGNVKGIDNEGLYEPICKEVWEESFNGG